MNRLGTHADFERVAPVSLAVHAVLSFREQIFLLEFGFARVEDDVRRKVKHAFEGARGHVEEQTHAARNSFEVPDVADGCGKFNVPHAFAANFCARDFDAAAVADCALVTDALIFSAVAFPVARRSEDTLAEQSVAFRLERAIINRFGLLHFAVRPLANFFRRRQPDSHRVKNIYVKHYASSFLAFRCQLSAFRFLLTANS